MRNTLLFLLLLVAACSQPPPQVAVPPVEPEAPYISTKLGTFDVRLMNSNGKCLMTYSVTQHGLPESGEIVLDMESPCNFIHLGIEKLQSYEYGKDPFKYKIFIVTGGRPEEPIIRSDQLQPKGCGSRIQKILIYPDRMRVEFPAAIGGAWCPSEPIDEVMFAT